MAQDTRGRLAALSGITRTTTDHQEIRSWVESRGGRPIRIVTPQTEKLGATLSIDFSGNPSETFQVIAWEDFFRQFNAQKLAFVYQVEDLHGGREGLSNTFIERDRIKPGALDRSQLHNSGPIRGPGKCRFPDRRS